MLIKTFLVMYLSKFKVRLKVWQIAGLLGIFLSCTGAAAADVNEAQIPANVTPGLDYLLTFTQSDRSNAFDPQRLNPILRFVDSAKPPSTQYAAPSRVGGPGIYFEFELQRDLEFILRSKYHPDIPTVVFHPTSLRLGYWTEVGGQSGTKLPKLWQDLPLLNNPVVARGSERVAITPDQFTGAYYTYDIYRALVLFKWNHRNVLISLSKQKDKSSVGRKGYVLSENDWAYVYSGEKGLTKAGLGWASSYMYDSFDINIFYEIDAKRPLIRCGYFKWLRAGWGKINFVRKHHLRAGLQRYAQTLTSLLECPCLPAPDELIQMIDPIQRYSTQELRNKMHHYFDALETRYSDHPVYRRKKLSKLIQSEKFIAQMTPQQMQSLLIKEAFKKLTGKSPMIELAYR